MRKSQLKTLQKAHHLLDGLTDHSTQNSQLTARLNEAYDGLSQLMFYIEEHPEPTASPWQSLVEKCKQFYFKHIVGV